MEEVDGVFIRVGESSDVFPFSYALKDDAAVLRAGGTKVEVGGEGEGEDGGVVPP